MSRTLNFSKRNFKELIRDPISIIFAIALPLFLLFIFQQFSIPNPAFAIENFTPGVIIFAFSFLTLFTGMLVSKDRLTSLLTRLAISPMKGFDYILGYIFAIIPIVLIQDILIFLVAYFMGFEINFNIIPTILISIIVSNLFISLGILIGSIFSDKASNGISSIVIQLVCFTSGMYFPKEILGDFFRKICEILPFEASLVIIRAFLNKNFDLISKRHILVFVLYSLIIFVLAINTFKKNMANDRK